MTKNYLTLSLVTFALLCPTILEAIFSGWEKPLETLLDESCISFFLFPSNHIYKSLDQLLSSNSVSGHLLITTGRIKNVDLDRIRSMWPCFDVISQERQPNSGLYSTLRKVFINQPIFETRDSRLLVLSPENGTLRSELVLQHPIAHLVSSRPKDKQLWLSCPAKKKLDFATHRIIDQFSFKKQKWLLNSERIRELYRYCNPGKKSYYSGRDLTFTGLDTVGVITVSNQVAELVAKGLGATYKLKPTRGCREIKKALPKEKTTLGQVYFGHADFGGFTAAYSVNIARLFDYIIFAPEEIYFLGRNPKPLSQIKNVLYPLDAATWLLIYVSLVWITIVFFLIHKLNKEEGFVLDVAFLGLGILFGENHFRVFIHKPNSGVLLKLVWVIGTMLLVMAYHGNLKASLTKRSYEKPVSTINDMLDKDAPVYSYFPFANYINSTSPKGDLARHIKRKNTTRLRHGQEFKMAESLINGEEAFIMVTTYSHITMKNKYFRKFGSREFPLRQIDEILHSNHATFEVRKYQPQAQEIKNVVQGLVSAGIPNFLFGKYKYFTSDGGKQIPNLDESQIKLTPEHVYIVGMILVSSCGLGFASFLTEVFLKRTA